MINKTIWFVVVVSLLVMILLGVLCNVQLSIQNQEIENLIKNNDAKSEEINSLKQEIKELKFTISEKKIVAQKLVIERNAILEDNYPINDTDITKPSGRSSHDFESITKGTALEGIESALIEMEHQYSVNAIFILSVAQLESGWGTSTIARNKNNLFGMNAWGSTGQEIYDRAYYYDSKRASVQHFSELIRVRYFNKGLDTLEKIAPIYCELPQHWRSKIEILMKENVYRLNQGKGE